MTRFPTLMTDAEVSRNLRRHLLTIPGEATTFAYVTVAAAIESCIAHGFADFVLHAGKDDYLCTPAQRTLLEDGDAVPPPELVPSD